MPRIPLSTIALIASLAALCACGRSESSGANVTMRDMEVVDGTANDSMVDLDNATVDGTALENAAAAVAGNGSAVTNASAPAPRAAPTDRHPGNASAGAAE